MKQDIAIKIHNISKSFRVPHEKHNSLKDKAVHIFGPKSYTTFDALRDIDFEIKKGEFFGIVGKNGSGKSTLLKIIANIYQPTKGKVNINGSLAPFIELGVGFNPELTGRENVFLSGTILGMTRKKIESLYSEIVAFAELEEFMDQKLKNYSSGMQVRLAFSIAVRANADILLIDEVLAVGDAAFQQKCFNYFRELKESNTTVCFVTHDMNAVQQFCDKAIIIEKGETKLIGSPSEVADVYFEDNLVLDTDDKSDVAKSTIAVQNKAIDKKTKKLKLIIRASNPDKYLSYIGFSVIKDGITVAEINNIGYESDNSQITFEYSLDTSVLNPGKYEIAASLIDCNSKKILSHTKSRSQFILPGYDELRGGAIRLPSNWTRV